MLGEMEKGFNAFAKEAMASPEISKVVDQVGGVTAGAQRQLFDLMERYLTNMNLPSRAQLTCFDERLQAIETQLGENAALLRRANAMTPETAFGERLQSIETMLTEIAAQPRRDHAMAPETAFGERLQSIETQLAETAALLRRDNAIAPETVSGERLQAIETQLAEITALLRRDDAIAPKTAVSPVPKPQRVKRPPPNRSGGPQ
jgi:hypothetical protein